jgi:hypothetical protein
MENYGKVTPYFLNLALVRGEWSASRLRRFNPAEYTPGTHWKVDCVGPRAGMDAVEKRKLFCPSCESNPDLPFRSLSLYRLSYLGFVIRKVLDFISNIL